MKIKGKLIFDQEENIYLEENDDLKKSVLILKPFTYKISNAFFIYLPYFIEGEFNLSEFKENNIIFFRFEKFGNKRIKETHIKIAIREINEFMKDFYKLEFSSLKNSYLKNIYAARDLSDIFASSIRETDSFKSVIIGLKRHFGFDKIRFYLVNEQENSLTGMYSTDIIGRIKSLEYEKIILEKGMHRFADILLGENDSFKNYYSDYIFYLPLKIKNKPMGLFVFDNLLSQIKINNDQIQILKSFSGQIAMAIDNIFLFRKTQELSLHDELTKLPIRRYFNSKFQEEFYRAERFNQPLSIIWIDIDYFKEINDTYGHQIGDVVLKEISRVIMTNLRKIDFPCRYGGDEIIILLPQAGEMEALNLARRLLNEIRNIKIEVPFSPSKEITLTASIGIATYPSDALKMDELLSNADEALYIVKSKGRKPTEENKNTEIMGN